MKLATGRFPRRQAWRSLVATGAQMALIFSTPVYLYAADRMNDRDVKQLVEEIRSAEDKFDDALDDSLKNGHLRGPNGDVDVKEFLHDFEENIDRIKDRFNSDYSASTEVRVVLQQATSIETFFKGRPAGTKGESEWNRLADHLRLLAASYHTSFPLAADAAVRRMNDKEIEAAANAVEKNADQFKSALESNLKSDPSMDDASRKQIVNQADQLAEDAKALRSRVSDGKPSSGEAERMLEQARSVSAWLAGRTVAAPVMSSWSALGPHLDTISAAYGLK